MKRIFIILFILLSSSIAYAKNCSVDTLCENSYMIQNDIYYKDTELFKSLVINQQVPIVINFSSRNRDLSSTVDTTGTIASKPYFNIHNVCKAANRTIYVYEGSKGFYKILHFTEPIKLTCKA